MPHPEIPTSAVSQIKQTYKPLAPKQVEFWNTHRPLSSPFLGLPYRIQNIDHEKELLSGLWVVE